jgi:hypothetical protein
MTDAWPTPRASEAGPDFAKADRSSTGMALPALAASWPTPATRDYKGANGADHLENGTGRLHLDQLPNYVAHLWETPKTGWPTPDAAVFGLGSDPDIQADRRARLMRKHGNSNGAGMTIATAAQQWATPSVAISGGGQVNRSGARAGELLLGGQSMDLCSSLGPAMSTGGAGSPSTTLNAYLRSRAMICSSMRSEVRALARMGARSSGPGWAKRKRRPFVRPAFRRQLNPVFVGDLMGWPPGLTSFVCSETASSIWKARMRSALWSLSLPQGPPAQLSLFG